MDTFHADASSSANPGAGVAGADDPVVERTASGAGPGVGVLSWPPPGLGRMQGDLWQVIKQGGLGGVLLVLPLLWAAVAEPEFWSLGPFGTSWWILLLTSAVGLTVLTNAFVDLFRLFRRGARATDRGYGWVTVAAVAVDSRRDTGFLLQGGRAYSVLPTAGRRRLIVSRLYSGALYLAAVLWLPVGFAGGVLLSARETLSPAGLCFFTLTPASLFLAAGLVLRAFDSYAVRRAKRQWFQRPWSHDLAASEVRAWNAAYEERREDPLPAVGSAERGSYFRLGAGLVPVLALLVFVPALTLIFSTAVGPLMASVSLPDYTATQRRAATVEAYRHLVVPPDPDLTPQEAGAIFHTLTFAGVAREILPLERAPAVNHTEPWIPDLRGGPTGVFPARWSGELVSRAGNGLSDAEIAFLEDVEDHPALPAFRRLATAPALDVGAGRWQLPFPGGTTIVELPLPELSAIRQAGWAMVGSAALATAEGRLDEAERTLREVISVGFLLGDHATTVVENLIGYVLVNTGGEALESFYSATGRTEDSTALVRSRSATERTAEMAAAGMGADLEGTLRQIPAVVANPRGIRGIRWSYFIVMNTLAPCLDTHKMVFGPGNAYSEWVRRSERDLVRWESEAALFELARNGMFQASGDTARRGGALGTVLGLTLGGDGQSGSCASLLGDVRESESS